MSHLSRVGFKLVVAVGVAIVVVLAMFGVGTHAQSSSYSYQDPPYQLDPNWKMPVPQSVKWGAVIGAQFDTKGNIWVVQRGQPGILQFDRSGTYIKSFADGAFIFVHGGALDPEGNLWTCDAVRIRTAEVKAKGGKGWQCFKFSPEGKILMTLGKAGVQFGTPGAGPDTFVAPSAVAIAPNGDIFVGDGHMLREGDLKFGDGVVKFSKDGKFIKRIGQHGDHGAGPLEFWGIHAMAFDSRGRLFVADRSNNRIQILDQEGNFIDQWKQFSRPTDIFIGKDDLMVVGDDETNPTAPCSGWKDGLDKVSPASEASSCNPGFHPGIRFGSAKTGAVFAFLPGMTQTDPREKGGMHPGFSTMDSQGNLWVSGAASGGLQKWTKR